MSQYSHGKCYRIVRRTFGDSFIVVTDGTIGAEESSSSSRHFRNTKMQHRWPPFLYFFCTPAIRGPPLPRSVLKATSPALSAFRQALSR